MGSRIATILPDINVFLPIPLSGHHSHFQFFPSCHIVFSRYNILNCSGLGLSFCLEKAEREMKHLISALVQNVPGVLSHVSGMLAARGYNIESLAVGETEDPKMSRMTFVVVGDTYVLSQVRAQLAKLVTVVDVQDLSAHEFVERDLMLIRVKAGEKTRSSILELVQIFRASVLDVTPDYLMIEVSGNESKVEAFIDVMRPYGIVELVRTGRIALARAAASETLQKSKTGD